MNVTVFIPKYEAPMSDVNMADCRRQRVCPEMPENSGMIFHDRLPKTFTRGAGTAASI
jgi:hypothetical protein